MIFPQDLVERGVEWVGAFSFCALCALVLAPFSSTLRLFVLVPRYEYILNILCE